jgi:Holliday junction resolvase RusA-like endonuclease
VVLSDEGKAYKETVAGLCLSRGFLEPLEGNVRLEIRCYRPRRAGDLDGILKILLDSMQGYVYQDDKQIVELHLFRFDDRENPRAEIEIEPVVIV